MAMPLERQGKSFNQMPKCSSATQKFQFLNMFFQMNPKRGQWAGRTHSKNQKSRQTKHLQKSQTSKEKNKNDYILCLWCQMKKSVKTQFSFRSLKQQVTCNLRVCMCVCFWLSECLRDKSLFHLKIAKETFNFCCDLFESNRSAHFRFFLLCNLSTKFSRVCGENKRIKWKKATLAVWQFGFGNLT